MVDHEKWKLNKITRKMRGVSDGLGRHVNGASKGIRTYLGKINSSAEGPLFHIKGYLGGGVKNAKTATTMVRGYLGGGVKNAKTALTFLKGRVGPKGETAIVPKP
mmetsp:Transcript_9075/g.15591  ORF Transcript_9075/g.15591 Transcript_9075/m.15591 type:complete len:105 (+) Transcript_9075:180-494(+)|eukprot:CAMPEP_0198217170 /NCGR_PEP_ID=MMETSP1445-20131203/62029_1 /TAXON_ID=36898 /ORGANISM="Pyramimonas sp., Strain CCMP2087" /LENGTH=104 /DNA_ID=CAMNT_0043893733 /DNA_START=105 /DNA_END=419 /DNA_ORIENTATION=+